MDEGGVLVLLALLAIIGIIFIPPLAPDLIYLEIDFRRISCRFLFPISTETSDLRSLTCEEGHRQSHRRELIIIRLLVLAHTGAVGILRLPGRVHLFRRRYILLHVTAVDRSFGQPRLPFIAHQEGTKSHRSF